MNTTQDIFTAGRHTLIALHLLTTEPIKETTAKETTNNNSRGSSGPPGQLLGSFFCNLFLFRSLIPRTHKAISSISFRSTKKCNPYTSAAINTMPHGTPRTIALKVRRAHYTRGTKYVITFALLDAIRIISLKYYLKF